MSQIFVSKEDQFAQFIKEFGDQAYNFAFRLSGNEQDSRDLVQGAFMKALDHFNSFDPAKPFQPWLNRILRNLYIDSVKRYEKRKVVSLDAPSPLENKLWSDLLPDRGANPLDELNRIEIDELVQKGLNRLELEYRTAIILSDIEGFSYEEISKIMNCPIGTVRSRIHRGRLMLKKILEPYMGFGEVKINERAY